MGDFAFGTVDGDAVEGGGENASEPPRAGVEVVNPVLQVVSDLLRGI